jgi:2-methylcitrate dehydratase PrpD
MTIYAEDFSNWAINLKTKDIPTDVQEVLGFLVKDISGVIIAARNEDYIQSLVKTYSNTGNTIALGHKNIFDVFSSSIICGTAAHGEDFDDTFEGNPMHVGATMVSVFLSAGQFFKLNGEQILRGIAIGAELICRMALVSPTAMHKQGFHPTAICSVFGAAAGLGVVLGLNSKQLSSALGVAGSMASGIIEYLAEGTWTKRIHPGWAASSGIHAALLGRSDFLGPRTVFEGTHGFFKAFTIKEIEKDFSHLTKDLGTRWECKNLAFKPYACGTMAQPFVDCAMQLRDKVNDLSKIKSIKAKVGEGTVHRLWEPRKEKNNPSTPYSAKFSVPYCVAVTLSKGGAGLEEFNETNIADQSILKIANLIEYEIDPNDEYPKNYTGRLTLETVDGQIIEAKQPCFRGGKKQPLTKKDFDTKFEKNLKYAKLNDQQVKNVEEFTHSIFDNPDFSKINLF